MGFSVAIRHRRNRRPTMHDSKGQNYAKEIMHLYFALSQTFWNGSC
jgi:hypothetical protein